MAGLDLTSFDPLMKQWYTKQRIENMVYQDNPLLAMLTKKNDFYGRNRVIPIKYGNTQKRSATFSNAQANTSTSLHQDFLLTRVKDYAIAEVDGELLLASQNDKGAFMQALMVEIDSAIEQLKRSLAYGIYGTGGGAIGRVANTSFATAVMQLVSISDVTNFEVGQICIFDSVNGTGTAHSGTLTVTAINRDTGAVTFNGNLSGISGIATNDYVFPQGDYGSKMSGLLAWVPDTAPTSGDSFFGVDRSSDVTRLGGLRYDATGVPIDEALINAAIRLGREGGRPTHVFMPDSDVGDLINALGSKVDYYTHSVGDIGFEALKVRTPRGVVSVIADHNCPADRAFMLNLPSWELCSIGDMVRFAGHDQNKVLRKSDADSVEARLGFYGNLGCRAPGWNVNIKLR